MSATVPTLAAWSQQRLGRRLIIVGSSGVFLGVTGLAMTFAIESVGALSYGLLLVGVGGLQLTEVLRTKLPDQRILRGVLGVMYVGSGVTLIALPPGLMRPSAVLIAILILAAGLTRAIWAHAWPGAPRIFGYTSLLAYSLAALLLALAWPAWALWALGVAVSLDLAVYGLTSILVGLAVRDGSEQD